MAENHQYAFSEQLLGPDGPATVQDYPSNQHYDGSDATGSNGSPLAAAGRLSEQLNYRANIGRTNATANKLYEVPSDINGGTVGESSQSFVHQPPSNPILLAVNHDLRFYQCGGGSQIGNISVLTNRSRSPPRSVLELNVYERAELELQSKHYYDITIDYMRESGRYNEKEIFQFKKAAIIKKCVEDVNYRADYQDFVRHSPSRYDNVKSKVARNLKVQKSVTRRSRKERKLAFESAVKGEPKQYKWLVEDTQLKPSQSYSPRKFAHNYNNHHHHPVAETQKMTPSFTESPSGYTQNQRSSSTSPAADYNQSSFINRSQEGGPYEGISPLGKPNLQNQHDGTGSRKSFSLFVKRPSAAEPAKEQSTLSTSGAKKHNFNGVNFTNCYQYQRTGTFEKGQEDSRTQNIVNDDSINIQVENNQIDYQHDQQPAITEEEELIQRGLIDTSKPYPRPYTVLNKPATTVATKGYEPRFIMKSSQQKHNTPSFGQSQHIPRGQESIITRGGLYPSFQNADIFYRAQSPVKQNKKIVVAAQTSNQKKKKQTLNYGARPKTATRKPRARSPVQQITGPVYIRVPLIGAGASAVSVSPQKPKRNVAAENPYNFSDNRNSPDVSKYQDKLLNSAPAKRHQNNSPQSNSNYRNDHLERKTAAIQREYENLLQEMLDNRQKQSLRGDDDGFYWAMNDYLREYTGSKTGLSPTPDWRDKDSPTKRLIKMKNSAVEHKKVMHQIGFERDLTSMKYQLTYCSSPGKSYVIQPIGGKLKYNLVDHNPERFYKQVFNQEITQTKVKSIPDHRHTMEVTTKVTKRPYMKIMEKIRGKIAERLRQKFGQDHGEAILEALKDQHIEHQIILLLRQDKIYLVNQHNQPIYLKQIQDALEHHEKLQRGTGHMLAPPNADTSYIQDGVSDCENMQHPIADRSSPTSASQVSRSKLEMQEQDLRRIETEVREHLIKRGNTIKSDDE